MKSTDSGEFEVENSVRVEGEPCDSRRDVSSPRKGGRKDEKRRAPSRALSRGGNIIREISRGDRNSGIVQVFTNPW